MNEKQNCSIPETPNAEMLNKNSAVEHANFVCVCQLHKIVLADSASKKAATGAATEAATGAAT